MANIVITSTAKTFKVQSGLIYANAIGTPLVVKKRSDITGVYYSKTNDFICVEINGIKDFLVAPASILNANGSPINVIVDSINGIPLISLQAIFDNFVVLMEV